MPITIVNIGVAMTTDAEKGNGTTFGQRLYRHEIRHRSKDAGPPPPRRFAAATGPLDPEIYKRHLKQRYLD